MKYLAPHFIPKERCLQVKPQPKRDWKTDTLYTDRWARLRGLKRRHNPLCEECRAEGNLVATSQVHHIKPIRTHPELAFEWSNLKSVCDPCHRRIHGGDFDFWDE